MPALLSQARDYARAAWRAARGGGGDGDGDGGLPSGAAHDFIPGAPRRGFVARMRSVSGGRTTAPHDDVALFCVCVVACALLQYAARYACMRIDAHHAAVLEHVCSSEAMPRWRVHDVPATDHVRMRLGTALLYALDARGPSVRHCWSATWLCESWAALAFRARAGDDAHVVFAPAITQHIGERLPMVAVDGSRRVVHVAPAVRIKGDDGVEYVLDGEVATCVQIAIDQMQMAP